MCGNVEEWCLDWYGFYIDKEQIDFVGYLDGIVWVIRGGSYNILMKYFCLVNCMVMLLEDKYVMIGFWVVQVEYLQIVLFFQLKDEYVVFQIKWDWIFQCIMEFVFIVFLVYVYELDVYSGMFFFKYNYQLVLIWCDNGDLLVVWFFINEEKGCEMVVFFLCLCVGSCEWEKFCMFYQIVDCNLIGIVLLNDC